MPRAQRIKNHEAPEANPVPTRDAWMERLSRTDVTELSNVRKLDTAAKLDTKRLRRAVQLFTGAEDGSPVFALVDGKAQELALARGRALAEKALTGQVNDERHEEAARAVEGAACAISIFFCDSGIPKRALCGARLVSVALEEFGVDVDSLKESAARRLSSR